MAIYYHKSLEQVGEEFVSSSSSGLFMRCSEVSSGPAIIWRVLLGPEDSFLRGAYSYGWEVDADEVNPLHVSFLSFPYNMVAGFPWSKWSKRPNQRFKALMPQPRTLYTVTSTIFYWIQRATLIQCESRL